MDEKERTIQLLAQKLAQTETNNAYAIALLEAALEREANALLQKLEKAESVEVVNKIPWPEWVGWEALPLRLKLEVEQTYPEASNK